MSGKIVDKKSVRHQPSARLPELTLRADLPAEITSTAYIQWVAKMSIHLAEMKFV